MNKLIFAFSLCSGLFLSGCVSKSAPEGSTEYIIKSAQYCTDIVKSKSDAVGGKFTLSGINSDMSSKSVTIRDRDGVSKMEQYVPTTLAYAKSTALDNGKPGSAWFNCMSLKNIDFQ